MAELILVGGAIFGLVVAGLLNFLLARSGRVRSAMVVCGVIVLLIVAIIALSTLQPTYEARLMVNLTLFWIIPASFGALLGLIFGRHSYKVRMGHHPSA